MIYLSDPFDITQTVVFFLIAFFSLIVSVLIFSKDRSYALNRSFSLGVAILGMSYVFSFLGNFYYILTENGDIIFIRTAFFLAPVAFMFFYFTAIGIYKGVDSMYKISEIILFIVIIIIEFTVIYIFDGITFAPDTQTNSISTLPFKIVNLGTIAVLYLVIYYFFIQSYRTLDDPVVKNNLRFFLIGWFFGGLGFISIIGSDAFRVLDLVGPLLICIGIIIISRSFISKKHVLIILVLFFISLSGVTAFYLTS